MKSLTADIFLYGPAAEIVLFFLGLSQLRKTNNNPKS